MTVLFETHASSCRSSALRKLGKTHLTGSNERWQCNSRHSLAFAKQSYNAAMVLNQVEIDECRKAFHTFDKDNSGTIDVWELKAVLEGMGQAPTEEELFQMISEVDDNMSGSIGA